MQANEVGQVNRLSLDEIKEIGSAAGPCITILMPLFETPGETGQNAIRLRHALESVERDLQLKAIDGQQIRLLLDPIRELAGEQNWGADRHGLAIFRAPDLLRAYRVPRSLPELVTVGDHFLVTPILPLLNADQTFYVLALSQKHIRLLRCNEHECEEVALPASTPKTLWEDKQTDQPDHDLDNRSAGGPSTGGMKGVTFTTSTDREDRDEYLLHFYKHVSQGLHELLKDDRAPLVIAGVDYEIALFRRENQYPHLAEQAVHGAPDGLKGPELHKRALEAVAPCFEAPLKKALDRFEQAGVQRSSTTIREIVKAAWDGRVLDLIVAEGAQYMGNFDEATHRVRKDPLLGEEDLLNAAALQTILHAGEVFVVPASKIPHGAPAAAVFRY